MTETTNTIFSALRPQAYLDLGGSPLGPALLSQALLGIDIEGASFEECSLALDTLGKRQRIRAVHAAGLELTVTLAADRSHGALVWHLDMEQHGKGPGPRVHNLRPLSIALDGTKEPDPVIHTWRGGAAQSFFPPDAVTPEQHVLYPRTAAYYSAGHFRVGTRGGRPSDSYMPYLLISDAEERGGLWCALGWGGNWTAHFVKPKDSADLHLTVEIEPCNLSLPAGTRLHGPAMALGLYQGDFAAGCNALRRWLRSQMPALPDRDLSHFNTWTAMDADVGEARLLAAAEQVSGQGLHYFMLDAGWYPAERENFSSGVGNWRVDETKFPRGLEVVAERVRERGMEMGLWIEPERAHLTSELARQHPDWLLTVPGREHALVNFALPQVRAHFKEVIGGLVRRLGLRWLKWDYNIDPLPYWQAANDGGLSHMMHADGVWETLDWLRASFPNLTLENCASGGNRLDWMTFSRTHVNFANDQYTQPDCIRRILGRMAAFLPSERLNMIYGPYQRRDYDDAAWQVLQGSAFGVSEPVENWSAHFREHLRRHLGLHRETDVWRAGNFYRLTEDTPVLRAWEGWQFHDPQSGSGLLALWRSQAPEERLTARVREIDAARSYRLTNLYTGEARIVAGAQLAQGLAIGLAPDEAALLTYRPLLERRTR